MVFNSNVARIHGRLKSLPFNHHPVLGDQLNGSSTVKPCFFSGAAGCLTQKTSSPLTHSKEQTEGDPGTSMSEGAGSPGLPLRCISVLSASKACGGNVGRPVCALDKLRKRPCGSTGITLVQGILGPKSTLSQACCSQSNFTPTPAS